MLRTTFVKVMATFEYDPPNRYEVVASRTEAGTSTASSHAKPKQACWRVGVPFDLKPNSEAPDESG